jgi:hypothetical protein
MKTITITKTIRKPILQVRQVTSLTKNKKKWSRLKKSELMTFSNLLIDKKGA